MVIFQSYICYILNTKRVVSSPQLDGETKPTQNILRPWRAPFRKQLLSKGLDALKIITFHGEVCQCGEFSIVNHNNNKPFPKSP